MIEVNSMRLGRELARFSSFPVDFPVAEFGWKIFVCLFFSFLLLLLLLQNDVIVSILQLDLI